MRGKGGGMLLGTQGFTPAIHLFQIGKLVSLMLVFKSN
jgi:hypothetical protein